MLNVVNVTKRFGDHVANSNVNIKVQPGRIFGLLGPNGAGKTTLIRIITQIIAPDSGTISLEGIKDEDRSSKIGYMPEERGLYKKLPVLEQIVYFASLKGLSRTEAEHLAHMWLERMDAKGWETKKVQELSKGMQQKVQFIATVLHGPSLLILDEPFSGLDPVNADLFIGVIKELQARGTTIMLSTHQMDQVERLCDDIALINRGQVVLHGPLADIRSAHSTHRVRLRVRGSIQPLTSLKHTTVYATGADWVELEHSAEVSANDILRSALEFGNIEQFNIVEPTLHEIFIKTVTSTAGSNVQI